MNLILSIILTFKKESPNISGLSTTPFNPVSWIHDEHNHFPLTPFATSPFTPCYQKPLHSISSFNSLALYILFVNLPLSILKKLSPYIHITNILWYTHQKKYFLFPCLFLPRTIIPKFPYQTLPHFSFSLVVITHYSEPYDTDRTTIQTSLKYYFSSPCSSSFCHTVYTI